MSKGHLNYEPAPVNVLRNDYASPTFPKNTMQGQPYTLVRMILREAYLPIPMELSGEKVHQLFWKHRPGLTNGRVVRYYDEVGYAIYGSDVQVNRKKFRRWVLRNYMKFLMTAKECHRLERKYEEDMEREYRLDREEEDSKFKPKAEGDDEDDYYDYDYGYDYSLDYSPVPSLEPVGEV